ncbi:hypothetical protein AAFF_G00008770 [Aldrovandia affinis]|uniref:Uncharacterized protein n=1 Tax=Aldrovandia affinis TaxID=143900 RepID=A0AAD7T680_9TELE|nr:hypothetical protein AAFF_G00008770 [Aldrovandia affinis]
MDTGTEALRKLAEESGDEGWRSLGRQTALCIISPPHVHPEDERMGITRFSDPRNATTALTMPLSLGCDAFAEAFQ